VSAREEFVAAMRRLMSHSPLAYTLTDLRKLAVAFAKQMKHAHNPALIGTCGDPECPSIKSLCAEFLRDCGLEADDDQAD
jgi:hypothetical protein